MNESCLTWMSHVSYEWVMSHMNEPCLIWMSHVAHERVTHMNESWKRYRHLSIVTHLSHVNENIKVSTILYHWFLLSNPFCFCETSYLHFTTRVFDHSAISPILGGLNCPASCDNWDRPRKTFIWGVLWQLRPPPSQCHASCVTLYFHMRISRAIFNTCTWMRHVSHARVMSHKNESCPIWMSHVLYEWVMSYKNESCFLWMGHVSYKWVMSRKNESCLIWMRHAL